MENSIRLDKWLWAARFFKTRRLATEAVAGGRVHLNSQRIKPAKIVAVGDRLTIQRGSTKFEVVVQAINDKRRPAPEAQLLYKETEESMQQREQLREMQRLASQSMHQSERRPNKKQRSQIIRFKRKEH